MRSSKIVTNITLRDDEELSMQKKKKYLPTPNYYKVGNGTYSSRYNMSSIDLMNEILEMTVPEAWLLRLLKDNLIGYDSTEVSLVDVALTDSDKQKLKIAYKRLRDKDLVRRIKRQHYMINPVALIPSGVDVTKEVIKYKELK